MVIIYRNPAIKSTKLHKCSAHAGALEIRSPRLVRSRASVIHECAASGEGLPPRNPRMTNLSDPMGGGLASLGAIPAGVLFGSFFKKWHICC
jgi:hypothetical protein